MAAINWLAFTERLVGLNHPSLTDTVNRAVRQILTESGYDPDADPLPGLFGPVFNVRAFGAAGDGSSTDTSGINLAIAALNTAGGGLLFFPKGTYLIDGALTEITAACVVMGAGASSIISCSANADVLTLSGAHARVQSLRIVRTGTVTSGAGIKLSGPYQVVDNVRISTCFYGIHTDDDAYGWTVRDSYIVDFEDVGLFVAATDTELDRGDQLVVGVTFDSSVATSGSACIRYQAHGGLKVTGCKLLHGDYGIDLSVIDGASTSILLVTDTSIEIPEVNCIRLRRAGTTGAFKSVSIVGCQMFTASGLTAVVLATGVNAITMSGCVLESGGGASVGVDITGGDMRSIDACTFVSFETGIQISNTATRVAVGTNLYPSVDTPIVDNTASTNTGIELVDHRYRRPVQNVTSDAAYTDVFGIVMPTNTGCRIEIVAAFLLQGVGPAARTVRKLITRAGAGCTVTDVDDEDAGAAIDLQFDVATESGSVLVGIKRNVAAGGTALNGSLTLIANGRLTSVDILV